MAAAPAIRAVNGLLVEQRRSCSRWPAYGVYLTGFGGPEQPDGTTTERVEISYLGRTIATLPPDSSGGVYVEVPIVATGPVSVTARSTKGTTATATATATPAVPGLWANSTKEGALTVTGADTTVTGPVHSNGSLSVTGARTTVPAGAEYVTTLTVRGNGHQVTAPRKVTAGSPPAVADIAAYRPGGAAAKAAGSMYRAIPASACKSGTWTARPSDITAGVLYVPCTVTVTGSGRINATIAAEGSVHLAGTDLAIGPDMPGRPAIVSSTKGSAVQLTGASNRILGAIHAVNGQVTIAGARNVIRCGVVADTITVVGAGTRVEVDNKCRA
ncbi:hypothetical protein Val02_02540 [Virgisporangium aliadipatigenens]|uniref:Uncharacterized protein n=2 Tax=Virgisporangium aliadipatigenens TaxID=741659 RepID=A0A8J3YFL3_9ACTN|nr:hypothetical protein Val02_02540 [Virgisporangium aliadipatigenens]